jgi:hypothetical protein
MLKPSIMKKSRLILVILLISAFSLAGCNNQVNKNTYQSPKLGLALKIPNDWSIKSENNTSIKLINDSISEQSITINKFKSINDHTDIWQFFDEQDFPTPSKEYEKITIGKLPALQNTSQNTVIVPKSNQYYIIQDCFSLSCEKVNEETFMSVVNSIEFIN